MLDTELHKKGPDGEKDRGLDADRFYHGYVLEPSAPIYIETTLFTRKDGRLCVLYHDFSRHPDVQLCAKLSNDAGRTWGEPWELKDSSGKAIQGFHATIVRLKSWRLGLVCSAVGFPGAHPGRDGGRLVVFRTSDDEARTWSDPVLVDNHFAACTSGHTIVLPSGRIVAPGFKWVSPIPGNEAEGWITSNDDPSPTLSYSFVFVSDDKGKTWTRSLSELFVSVRRAAYDLEEPTVVELKDGRLLMHCRSELGRMYRSFSKDGGLSWSRPAPLQMAASYTPHLLRRIPSTGHLLLIWNQSSRQEIVTGLHRHRLSCAVSKDEGETWENFKNLESLDDVTIVTPPPADLTMAFQPHESYGYYQPSADLKRYRRSPGVLRICYPDVAFVGDEAIIVYDHGFGILGDEKSGTKLRAIPVGWFTS